MSADIKPYKLVPLKLFRDLTDGTAKASNNSNYINSSNTDNNDNSRTIGDIQERAIGNIVNTTSDDLQIPSIDQQMEWPTRKGRGGGGDSLMWLHDDKYKLPQFSSQRKIEDNYEQYKNILNAKDIPDDLKIKLMNVYKNRYDSSRHPPSDNDGDDDDDDDDDNGALDDGDHNNSQKIGAALAIAKTAAGRMSLAKKLVEEMMRHPQYISWNRRGLITLPIKYKHSRHMNLYEMLNILTGKKSTVNQTQLKIIIHIIRPFYRHIKPHVKNETIIKQFDEWDHSNKTTASDRFTKRKSTPKSFYSILK